jgi:hypothetical protein
VRPLRLCLAVAVEVTVGGEDNLTGRVFLTGKARQRKRFTDDSATMTVSPVR